MLDEPRPVRAADDRLRRLGGAAGAVGGLPRAIGLPILQAWGMTETSPLGTSCRRSAATPTLDEEQARRPSAPGRASPLPLVELRIVDPDTREPQPWDDKATGELQAAGPWIASEYYHGEGGGDAVHRGRLAAHRRRRGDRPRTAPSGSSTAPRT